MLDLKMKLQFPSTYPIFLLLFVVSFCLGTPSSMSFGQDRQDANTVGSKRKQRPKLERDVLQGIVAKLAADLDAVKQAVRDQAEAELIAIGPSVIEFLPPVGVDAPGEWKMRIERLRNSLEQLEMQEFTLPSTVTLAGSMTGREALTKIAEETGNTIDLGETANLDREVLTDFDATPFWEAFDEVLDQLELTVMAGDGETMQLAPRATNAPLRIAAAGYSGVFRIEPLTVQKTYQLQDPGRSTLRVEVLDWSRTRVMRVVTRYSEAG